MRVVDSIEAKLRDQFEPESLEVEDQSHLHAGHAGARPEGETHFEVRMVAQAFSGLNRVARQRAVYQCLSEELSGPVHALALKLQAPEEV